MAARSGRFDPATAELEGVPKPGDSIAGGKYLVDSLLAVGGMGAVVLARHVRLDQRVAIKFLLPSAVGDGDSVARFLREARAAASLRNEHVVRVVDVDVLESGMPYIVMERLSGVDLSTLLSERGRIPVPEAVGYLLQACEGLAEAHARRIVHRDLKPGNLFLARRSGGGTIVKVLDFGIAKALSPDLATTDLTSSRAVVGSPRYMSPEQIRNPASVDLRCDIWALGVVLYELLTGIPPFDDQSPMAVSARIVADPPARLRRAFPDIPQGLEDVALRCLEKDPARRFQSVVELAEALAPFAPAEAAASVERIARLVWGPLESSPVNVDATMKNVSPTGETLAIDKTSRSIDAVRDDPARADAASRALDVTSPEVVHEVPGAAMVTHQMTRGRGSRRTAPAMLGAAAVMGAGLWLVVRQGDPVSPPNPASPRLPSGGPSAPGSPATPSVPSTAAAPSAPSPATAPEGVAVPGAPVPTDGSGSGARAAAAIANPDSGAPSAAGDRAGAAGSSDPRPPRPRPARSAGTRTAPSGAPDLDILLKR